VEEQTLPTMAPPIRSNSPPIPTMANKSMIDTMQQQFPPLDLKPLESIKMEPATIHSVPRQASAREVPTIEPSQPPPLIKQPSIHVPPSIKQPSFHDAFPSFDTKHILDQLSNIQKELKAEQEKVAEELNELQKPKTFPKPASPIRKATPPKKVTPPLIKGIFYAIHHDRMDVECTTG
jgi:hypothetical protein